MQLTQPSSGYYIPTVFAAHFNLDGMISELKNAFPDLIVNKKEADFLTAQDCTHLKILLEAVRSLTSVTSKPDISIKRVITKLDKALKDYAEVFRSSRPKNFSNMLSSTEIAFSLGITSTQSYEERLSFNSQQAPGKIAHNHNPNSCYVAVLLNTIRDENLKPLFIGPQATNTEENLSEKFQEKIGQIIRKLQNTNDLGIKESQHLLKEWEDKSVNGSLTELEQALQNYLKQYLQQIEQIEEKKKTSIKRQVANGLLNLIKEEIVKELQKVIGPCIDKINQGSNIHLKKCDEGVVSVQEIAQIQAVLRRYNFIERDYVTDEDPMGILHSILGYVAPDFALIKGRETYYYNLNEGEGEEVTLIPTQIGTSGVTIVDNEGKVSKEVSDITLSLSSQSGQVDLLQALNQHLIDDLEAEQATVYKRKEENGDTYIKYSNVARIKTTRTFSTAPLSLILEVKGSFDSKTLEALETKVAFQKRMDVTTEDGTSHYYALQQVNCHRNNHEYAYLNHQGEWYLSDDMQPVQKATIKQASPDTHMICRYGRTFIYKKVEQDSFEKIESQIYQYSLSPSIENTVVVEGDQVVSQQLQVLIQICKLLSDSKTASLQVLLGLSWGVGSIPKEKKFSKKWGEVISEHHWLLLEDISRQITHKFPKHPLLSDYFTKEAQQLVSQFSESAKILKNVFEILKDMESPMSLNPSLKAPEKPFVLLAVETLFYPEFDRFILDQIEHHMQILKTILGSQDPVQWLRENPIHVKALFRTIEVIGEASKILSKNAKQQLPTLTISGPKGKDKPLWGKLRNQLHHNKKRSWDIATLASEKWAVLLTQLFPKLEAEMTSYKNMKQTSSQLPTQPNANDIAILEDLSNLCGQDQFYEVRRTWHRIKADYQQEPLQLRRILFGFEPVSEYKWEIHVKPYLKPEVDAHKNQNIILEMLRIGSGNFIQDADIESLMPSLRPLDKKTAVIEMKRLLTSAHAANNPKVNKDLARDFEKLATQFVFFKREKPSSKTQKNSKDPALTEIIQRDTEKNEALKKVMSQRLSQVYPCQFSWATFKNGNQSLTDYGELLAFYIKLKHYRVSQLIKSINQSLEEIQAGWSEAVIDASNLQILGQSVEDTSRSKIKLIASLEQIQAEKSFIQLPLGDDLKKLIEDLKVFPVKRVDYHFSEKKGKQKNSMSTQQLVDEINKSKSDCMASIQALKSFLSQITYDESHMTVQANNQLNTAITLFETIGQTLLQNPVKAEEDVKKVKQIFTDLAFTDTETFIKELNNAKIDHPFTKMSPNFNSIRSKVVLSLESQLETDLATKIDGWASEAEDELSTSYVQKALVSNVMPISVSFKSEVDAKRHVVLIRDIYKMGLDAEAADYEAKLVAWDNIERKINSRRLTAKKMKKVLAWLPSDDSIKENKVYQTVKKELIAYLDGVKGFDLTDLPRFEHGHKKIEFFEKFLTDECFPTFPNLRDKKSKLLSYFKTACGIIDTQSKAQHFSHHFVSKIEKLGPIFSKIQELENTGTPSTNRDLLLLSAEYDMQDIGELAQLITDRPSLWDIGRHILSPQHLLWISLMRKMMAHYPLMLAPHIIRWNLEYLAFDTCNILSSNSSKNKSVPSYSPQLTTALKRKPITVTELDDKIFDIENYLDSLNLDIKLDVLYPSLNMPYQAYLHPFGELALMVYPHLETQSKTDFIHAVMELELILSHELGAKVVVIGNWKNENVNIPSENYMPSGYLEMAIEAKQTLHSWIISHKAYHLSLHEPWSYVSYQSGKVIARGDFELHHDLVFFLKVLEFQVGQADLERFVMSPNLDTHIEEMLRRQLIDASLPYPKNTLFKWVCCLFERFCPPEAIPRHPVCLPKSHDDSRRLKTMLDDNYNGLQLLPENIEDYKGDVEEVIFYYKDDGTRLDILNGRSLLDPSQPIKVSEISTLAEYAVAVLRSHINYIKEKLKPENGLARPLFRQIKDVQISDPGLVEKSEVLNTIPADIKKLIDQEARGLERKITKTVYDLSVKHGKDFCVQMLEWMKVDKEIERVARDYYGENRLRLKRLYIQMDEMSRSVFNHLFVTNSLAWSEFPTVNSFHQFLNRIHNETDSLDLDVSSGWLQVNGDFSSRFKALVPEIDMQKTLLDLMKKRQTIMQFAIQTFSEYHLGLLQLNEENYPQIKTQVNNNYVKWNQLFRMINSPNMFEVLKNSIHAIRQEGNRRQLLAELKQDFETQYKNPGAERESSAATSLTQKKRLYDTRNYFDGKNSTNQAKQEHENFTKILEQSPFKETFTGEWEKQYGEPFKPVYLNSLLVEARRALEALINSDFLSNYDFSDVPTYSDYWDFVASNQVEMSTFCMSSGVTQSFKLFIINGGTFQEIWNDPVKRKELEQNKKLHRLVTAYIPFFNLENTLSNVSYYIKMRTKIYSQLVCEKQEAEQSKKAEWVLVEYDRRIANIQYGLEKAYLRLEDTLANIIQTEFFQMLKLVAKRRHFLESKGEMLSEKEQKEQVLLQLGDEVVFSLEDSAVVLAKTSIKLGSDLELLLK